LSNMHINNFINQNFSDSFGRKEIFSFKAYFDSLKRDSFCEFDVVTVI